MAIIELRNRANMDASTAHLLSAWNQSQADAYRTAVEEKKFLANEALLRGDIDRYTGITGITPQMANPLYDRDQRESAILNAGNMYDQQRINQGVYGILKQESLTGIPKTLSSAPAIEDLDKNLSMVNDEIAKLQAQGASSKSSKERLSYLMTSRDTMQKNRELFASEKGNKWQIDQYRKKMATATASPEAFEAWAKANPEEYEAMRAKYSSRESQMIGFNPKIKDRIDQQREQAMSQMAARYDREIGPETFSGKNYGRYVNKTVNAMQRDKANGMGEEALIQKYGRFFQDLGTAWSRPEDLRLFLAGIGGNKPQSGPGLIQYNLAQKPGSKQTALQSQALFLPRGATSLQVAEEIRRIYPGTWGQKPLKAVQQFVETKMNWTPSQGSMTGVYPGQESGPSFWDDKLGWAKDKIGLGPKRDQVVDYGSIGGGGGANQQQKESANSGFVIPR